MKILISGASGFIGSALVSFLEAQQHQIMKLVRKKNDNYKNEIFWDPTREEIDLSALEGFDAVIHLAGESIMGFWTVAKKEKIRQSRVQGTNFLCKSLLKLKQAPLVFICASAVGYYGDRGDEILTEESQKGNDFLANVCNEWEEATYPLAKSGVRTINLRIGFVLSEKGGGLKAMLPAFKWGFGGKLGTGEQFMSWIALDDLIRIFDYVIHQERIAGPVNAVSPNPVKNQIWTKTLGHLLHRPTFLTIPTFIIKGIFGEMGQDVLLNSVRVVPRKLEKLQFEFKYPFLEQALEKALNEHSMLST